MKFKAFVLTLLVSLITPKLKSQNSDSLDVLITTQNFVKAFTSFDWKSFRNAFSSKASIFFPSWNQRDRKAGKKEIEATWTEMFPGFVDSTKRFDLKINPQDILIQLHEKIAIVTFHLGDGVLNRSRRTIFFLKENTDWKIIHLHASNLSKPIDN
jgi:hypothetical protein